MPSSNLPSEVTSDILRRLPVKSLIRFKCVSKPWCFIIDGPDFIKMQLETSLATDSNLSVILKDWRLHSVEFDSLEAAIELFPPIKFGGGTEAFGSCDGLLAVRDSEADLALWNPWTSGYQKLPVSPIDSPGGSEIHPYIFNGFGRDPLTDDYKVVRMVIFTKDDNDNDDDFVGAEVKIYSLKTNSWRRIKELPDYIRFMHHPWYYLFFMRWNGVLANGSLHWLAPPKPDLGRFSFQIVAFDLGAEEFHSVLLPDYGDDNFCLDVGVLAGRLCVVSNYAELRIDVWVMKEYGVEQSWTKMFSVDRPKRISSFRFLRPLAYSKSAYKVLLVLNNEKLAWYDLKTKKLRSVRIDVNPRFGAEMCVRSLIPLNRGGDEKKNKKQAQEEGKNNKNRKKRDDFLSEGFKLVL